MNRLLSSRRYGYVAMVDIFLIMLIMAALIAGMAGCGEAGPEPRPELECTPMVAVGEEHTVGLKSDGTVVAVGPEAEDDRDLGQCDVGSWIHIVQVAAGKHYTVGLKTDGTVVAVGYGHYGVGDWKDVIQVAAGDEHTVGLRFDGTVVASGLAVEVTKWDLF